MKLRFAGIFVGLLITAVGYAQVKVSSLSTLPANNATFVYGITNSSTDGKVPVNAANGLPIYDASANLLPTADVTGTLGLSNLRWLALNVATAGSPGSTQGTGVIFSDGATLQGMFGFLVGTGFYMRLGASNVNRVNFNLGSITSARTITFPDSPGTLTLLGNNSTGSGSVVLATSPTVTSPTFATSTIGGSGHVLYSATAPAIASGFGTSPSVVANNGTAAFTINVGTGGSASSGVVTMPAATTGWACNVMPNAAPQAGAEMFSAPTSTTSITITNYTASTGVALAWPASAVLQVMCVGY